VSGSAFDDYLTQWRGANPRRALAWLFLHPDERTCFGALAALLQEWHKAAREVSEPQVAVAKLGWWREEMQRAPQGDARHPLTLALFADPRARTVPAACWTAPVDALGMALAATPAADFAAQCAAATSLATAIAALETQVWFGPAVDASRAARVVLFTGLCADLRALPAEVARGRSPLPMNLLARHSLTIESLAHDGPGRRAALRDQVRALERGLTDAAKMGGPLTLFRDVGLQHDLAALQRAGGAADPLAALVASRHGLSQALKTWRAARKWRGVAHNESRT
jgi:phytoene synthase